MEKKLEHFKKLYHIYYILIFDERRIKKTINLFNILIDLILQWVDIDPLRMSKGVLPGYNPSPYISFIPEEYLTMIYEFHVFYLKHNEEYHTFLNNDQVVKRKILLIILSKKKR